MARKEIVTQIVSLFQKLGGNINDVLGTKTNINFLGKGKSPELMLDMDINPEALGVLPRSQAVEELKNSVGYLAAGKLNDIQANQLLKNMQTMDSVYFPPAAPKNVTDFATGTPELDKAGLMSLRQGRGDLVRGGDDLPPPGSRGGLNDIAAPFGVDLPEGIDAAETILPTGAGLEALKTVKNNDVIAKALADKVYEIAGVAEGAKPVARGNARDFLNRIKDMEDPTNPSGPTLSGVMEADDFKFMTEGGGGALGDPLLLVQKYFGPRVSAQVAKLDGPDEVQDFAEKLIRIKDGRGRSITDRNFDPDTVDLNSVDVDLDFANGGLASLRPGYRGGKLVGKALGLFKKQQAIEKGVGEGFAAAEQYGITGPMVSKLFREIAMDKSLVGKEKTEYFKILNEALKNPDKYPDEILEIQKKLGIDIGLKSGGLAKILEV